MPLRYRDALPGAALAFVGLLAVTAGFGQYVGGVNSPVAAVFGSTVAFLVWLYVVSLLLLVGAEVNGLLSARGRDLWRSR